MQKNAAHTYAISSLLVLSLTGCAWIPSTPLVQGATSAQPVPGPTPVANGSIFQSAQPINYGYQPLFEDRRPRNIGDTLTIVLQENVSASKSSSANASRDDRRECGAGGAGPTGRGLCHRSSLCPQTHQHDSADEIDKRQGEQNLQHEH